MQHTVPCVAASLALSYSVARCIRSFTVGSSSSLNCNIPTHCNLSTHIATLSFKFPGIPSPPPAASSLTDSPGESSCWKFSQLPVQDVFTWGGTWYFATQQLLRVCGGGVCGTPRRALASCSLCVPPPPTVASTAAAAASATSSRSPSASPPPLPPRSRPAP